MTLPQPVLIGVDVGGTTTSGGLVTPSDMVPSRRTPTHIIRGVRPNCSVATRKVAL